MPADVDWKQVNDDTGAERTCTVDNVEACTVIKGSGPHILVVGDSHAQMLTDMFTTMAKKHDLTLSLNVLGGCMWQEDLTNTKQSAGGLQTCEQARVGWYDAVLPVIDPDLVILVGRERDEASEWSSIVKRRDGTSEPYDQMMLDATQNTLDKIESAGPRALLVESMVMPNTFEPDDCLASAQDASSCAVPVPHRPPRATATS